MENFTEASIKDIAISRKAFMLKAARAIIKESNRNNSRTIELLKTMPICSFNTLEKYAKAVRDPDPVATVMTNINLKYPIICNKSWAKDNLTEHEKKEYLGADDYRVTGAISCKKN
ncbi:unnamed protein product [Macrosiphum euphorbiae]|uniref:Uncharacterized protein n=1 Tax=Macrosiphum euphorbiae TaxID=13131 RepID=A0AAV0XNC6_9HEMI|nr:unnamed protein product [Macrosiphum euphorbiae]